MKSSVNIGIMGESEKLFQQPSDPFQRPVRRSPVPDQDSTTRLIPLRKTDKVAIVDAADYELVAKFNWGFRITRNKYVYAATNRVYMHRVIMGAPKGMLVDHIDGDGLNNRRSNLRLATHMQNIRNTKLRKSNKSGFKGAFWSKSAGKWCSSIRIGGGQKKYLGFFATPEDAHAAYVEAAKKYHGEFANGG